MKTTPMIVGSLVAASQFLSALAVLPNPTATVPDLARRQKSLQLPSELPTPGAFKSQGCYKSNGNHTLNEKVTGQGVSSGSCQKECEKSQKWSVLSLQGSKCFCGDNMPPQSDMVSDSKCDYKCPAYGLEACGSIGGDPGYFSIFNLGRDIDPPTYEEEEEEEEDDKDDDDKGSDKGSGSDSPSTGAGPSSSSEPTSPAQTEDTSEEEQEDNDNSNDDSTGPNVGGIVGGSVVGVVAVAAGAGGLWFFMRRRRNTEIEEEHRRNAAVNAFISGSKPPGSSGSISMTDSRLDPVMAHRRMSDGSIADNEDYSRKILRVTNA